MDGRDDLPDTPRDGERTDAARPSSFGVFSHESQEERIQLLRWQGYSDSDIAALTRAEANRGWMIVALAAVALGTGVFGYFAFTGDIRQNDDYLRPSSESAESFDLPFIWGSSDLTAPDNVETDSVETAAAGTEATSAPATRTTRRPAPGNRPSSPTVSADPPRPVPATQTYRGPVADTVDRETQRALRSGKPQLWKEDGERGYVLVSGAVEYGDYTCRQVSYSKITDGGQVTSPSAQWCREGRRGKWRPDARSHG